jgi:hypothetical protein
MQPCNIMYYSTVHWRLNTFRAAYRSSSGALTVFAASSLHTHMVTGRSQGWVGTQFPLRRMSIHTQLAMAVDGGWYPASRHGYFKPVERLQFALLNRRLSEAQRRFRCSPVHIEFTVAVNLTTTPRTSANKPCHHSCWVTADLLNFVCLLCEIRKYIFKIKNLFAFLWFVVPCIFKYLTLFC